MNAPAPNNAPIAKALVSAVALVKAAKMFDEKIALFYNVKLKK